MPGVILELDPRTGHDTKCGVAALEDFAGIRPKYEANLSDLARLISDGESLSRYSHGNRAGGFLHQSASSVAKTRRMSRETRHPSRENAPLMSRKRATF